MEEKKSECSCGCHKMFGLFVALFGLVFLLRAFDVFSMHVADILWPVVVILAGLQKMTCGFCKCCKTTPGN